MKSRLTDLSACGLPQFRFAGMDFPKHLWTLPEGDLAARLDRHKRPVTGDYYHAPIPLGPRSQGLGFYLDATGPRLRWRWADQVHSGIPHHGWFLDAHQDDVIRGVVFRLPKGRGFLAGWSMGESMASAVDYRIWADEIECARRADRLAELAAEANWRSEKEDE
jgi:hypothetical protein